MRYGIQPVFCFLASGNERHWCTYSYLLLMIRGLDRYYTRFISFYITDMLLQHALRRLTKRFFFFFFFFFSSPDNWPPPIVTVLVNVRTCAWVSSVHRFTNPWHVVTHSVPPVLTWHDSLPKGVCNLVSECGIIGNCNKTSSSNNNT